MVVDPMSMCAHGCGPSEGLLHTTRAGTHKKVYCMTECSPFFAVLALS